MGKVIRLTESDLVGIIKKVLNEQSVSNNNSFNPDIELPKYGFKKSTNGNYVKKENNHAEAFKPLNPEKSLYSYLFYTPEKHNLRFPNDLGITSQKVNMGKNPQQPNITTVYKSTNIPVNRILDIIKISNFR